ncbi:UNVERIFIED_CONTAM: hypothetical protein BEN50_24770 [Euhalothece sp. KZN 001]
MVRWSGGGTGGGEFQQILVVPAADFHLAAEALLPAFGSQQVHRQAAQAGEVFIGVALAQAAVVFAVGHVQPPVQAVLHAPVASGRLEHEPGVAAVVAREVVPALCGLLAVDPPRRFHADEAAETVPSLAILEPVDVPRAVAGSRLDPAVALVDLLGLGVGHVLEARFDRLVEEQLHFVEDRRLIGFDLQQVIAARLVDLAGDLLLAVHGVGGDGGTLEVEQFEQLGHGGDLVALGLGGDLAQRHLVLDAPGADHVDRGLAMGVVEAAPQRLAVHGDQPPGGVPSDRLRPRDEASLERVGVERGEHAADRVVAGDAVGQVEEGLEPVVLGLAEAFDVGGSLGAADHREEAEGEDVCKAVHDVVPGPGVGQVAKIAQQIARGVGFHARTPYGGVWVVAQGLAVGPQPYRHDADRANDFKVFLFGGYMRWPCPSPL